MMLGNAFARLRRTLFGQSPAAPPAAPGEVAWADGLFFGRVPMERWNPDELLWRRGHDIYRRMLRDDQVRALLALKQALVTSRSWHFTCPEGSPEHATCAEFFRFLLEKQLVGTFAQALGNLLTSQAAGHSLVEKVYAPVPWQGKPHWGVRQLKLRPAESFTFQTDVHGNLTGLLQQQGTRQVALPPERFLRHVNKPTVHPQYGESDLRECYRHWWAKENDLAFTLDTSDSESMSICRIVNDRQPIGRRIRPYRDRWEGTLELESISRGGLVF